jgi:hypothetical protein
VGGLGYGQSWQDVTAARALGDTYTNSTGKPIALNVLCNSATAQMPTVTINGTVDLFMEYKAAGYHSHADAIIPAGATYRVSGCNTITGTWAELR